MIGKDELKILAGEKNLTVSALSKDYALGWLLFGISKSSVADRLVFKGGTALSKVYFAEDWRLSEDLDFTILDTETDFGSITSALEGEVPGIIRRENGMDVVLRDRPHTNMGYLQSRFQYTGPLGKDTVKIEISKEPTIAEIMIEKVPRVFDYPDFEVRIYSLEDILAEKMRSMIQRKRIRDYYDVWRLLKARRFDREKVKGIFLEKCKSKGIQFNGTDQFFPDDLIRTLEPYVEKGLSRLSREKLPSIESIIGELGKSLDTFLA